MDLPSPFYTVAWIVLGLGAAAVEALALRDPDSGDTLTEHLRYVLRRRVVWYGGMGLAIWAILHLFFGMSG